MKIQNGSLLSRLQFAFAPHEEDPIVTWIGEKSETSSEEIRRINFLLLQLMGKSRLEMTLDLLNCVIRANKTEVFSVFGRNFKCPRLLAYKVTSLGEMWLGLGVADLFWVSAYGKSRLTHSKLADYHHAIVSKEWRDETRWDDNRQVDAIRYVRGLTALH